MNIPRPSLLQTEIDLNSGPEEFEPDDREQEVLKLFSSDQNAHFSFQGLRRRLGFHQETLTRTLKRLEGAQVIERSPEGYKLKTSAAFSFNVRANPSPSKPIVDAYLPTQIDVTVLFQRLRGKWFSNFRWLGHSHDGNRLSMSWISDDGQMQLQASISEGKLVITVDSSEKEEPHRVSAAYQLFDHISGVTEDMMRNPSQTPRGDTLQFEELS